MSLSLLGDIADGVISLVLLMVFVPLGIVLAVVWFLLAVFKDFLIKIFKPKIKVDDVVTQKKDLFDSGLQDNTIGVVNNKDYHGHA